MYDLHMTHSDRKLDQDYGDDEIRCAQNEINGECVDKYAFPLFKLPRLNIHQVV